MRMTAVAAIVLATAAVSLPAAAAQGGTGAAVSAASWSEQALPRGPLLDVTYLPQTEDLCGGAAVAMVLRYWGAREVYPEDFAPLVDRSASGIHTDVLTAAVQQRGWQAFAYSAVAPGMGGHDIRGHLARGRPIIALIEVRPGRYHYVVIVGWTDEQVVLHDPARAPFEVVAIADFEDVWAATGFWALLVLPSENVASTIFDAVSPTVLDLGAPGDACGGLVSESVRLGRAGDLAGAETRLATAMTLCPLDSAVWRELAGIRFLQSRWRESSRLASHAVTLDPSDDHAWEVLASSRFLDEDPIGALEAWNHVGRPRIDIVRVEGAHRTRHPVVAELLDLPARSLLTPAMVRRASRRLRELPAAADSRVRYRLDDSGLAQVDAVIVERPVVPRGIVSIAAAAGQALVRRELRLDIAGPSGSGELWSAAWRWWAGRPRVGFELAVPSGGRLPGKTTLEASWEEQSYAHVGQVPTGPAAGTVVRQSRRRAGVRVADWATHALRWDLSGAFDRWDSESHVALSAGLDLRLAQDRVSLGVEASGWAPLDKGARFGRSEVTLGWRSSARDEGPAAWSATVGAAAATRAAPRGLWAGAGTGHARTPLLRAHPLLDDGVIQGPAFGRRLAYGSLEYHRPVWIRLWKLGFGAFVDTARAWDRDEPRGAMRLHVDAGVGVRLSVPGIRGSARLDLARGVRDGRLALSAAWQSPWPGR